MLLFLKINIEIKNVIILVLPIDLSASIIFFVEIIDILPDKQNIYFTM